jgi:cytidine deaminase
MRNTNWVINYREYDSLEELDPKDRALTEAAIEAQKTSYAPYSHFNVGAAVRLEDGTMVKGSNQENAASPAGLCAERTAMFAASAQHPGLAMESIAIAGGHRYTITEQPVSPCGSCRQVMSEYQRKTGVPMSIILYGKDKIKVFDRVEDILPFIFDSLETEK